MTNRLVAAYYLPSVWRYKARQLVIIFVFCLAFLALGMPYSEAGSLSRLNQMIQQKSRLFIPGRLYTGQVNKLIIQGKPGSTVVLYASPSGQGGSAPNGAPLRVGDNSQSFTSHISANGVTEIPVTLPEGLAGKTLFLDGVIYQSTDYSDMKHVDLVDAAGQATEDNRVLIIKQGAGGKGAFLMPSMPGLNPQALQQMQTASEASSSKDEHKKQLLYDGSIDQSRSVDQNSFYKLPGQATSITGN